MKSKKTDSVNPDSTKRVHRLTSRFSSLPVVIENLYGRCIVIGEDVMRESFDWITSHHTLVDILRKTAAEPRSNNSARMGRYRLKYRTRWERRTSRGGGSPLTNAYLYVPWGGYHSKWRFSGTLVLRISTTVIVIDRTPTKRNARRHGSCGFDFHAIESC